VLAGPAIIGPLTQLMPLNHTFFLPVALCVAGALSAQILRPRAAEPQLQTGQAAVANVQSA
jgi:hypothetical protein